MRFFKARFVRWQIMKLNKIIQQELTQFFTRIYFAYSRTGRDSRDHDRRNTRVDP